MDKVMEESVGIDGIDRKLVVVFLPIFLHYIT